jgi:HEAT repeat protein
MNLLDSTFVDGSPAVAEEARASPRGAAVSVRRYQVACAILAFTTVASVTALHQRSRAGAGVRPAVAGAGARSPVERLRRPVRVAASALGLSEAELIDRLLAARTAREVVIVAERLAIVGTDDAVLAMTSMIADPREGVTDSVISAIGEIGTARATDVVLGLLDDPRQRVRNAAVSALARVSDERAIAALCAIADDRVDPARLTAIGALGEQGGDVAIARLVAIARAGDPAAGPGAAMALAGVAGAQDALLALTDAPDLRVRAAALGALDASSPAAIARLIAVVAAGEPQTAQAALGALGRSGDPAVVPVLAKAAGQATGNLRWAAVSALGELGGPEAVAVLGELLAHAELGDVGQVAMVLASLGGDDARAALIGVALEGGRRGTAVTGALGSLRGEDVQAALLAIARDGTPSARRDALPLLLRAGAPEAVALATELVRTGGRADRLAAIAMLGDAPGDAARLTLLQLAERERGRPAPPRSTRWRSGGPTIPTSPRCSATPCSPAGPTR